MVKQTMGWPDWFLSTSSCLPSTKTCKNKNWHFSTLRSTIRKCICHSVCITLITKNLLVTLCVQLIGSQNQPNLVDSPRFGQYPTFPIMVVCCKIGPETKAWRPAESLPARRTDNLFSTNYNTRGQFLLRVKKPILHNFTQCKFDLDYFWPRLTSLIKNRLCGSKPSAFTWKTSLLCYNRTNDGKYLPDI